MPHHLERVIKSMAGLKGTTPEALREAIHGNLLRLLQDDAWVPERYKRLLSEPDRKQSE